MSLTKALVTEALEDVPEPRSGRGLVAAGVVQWVAACDDYASVRLHLPGAKDARELDTLAHSAAQAVRGRAARAGGSLSSLTVEFVDEAGTVVHSARVAGPAPSGPAAGATPPPPPSQRAGEHRPIGGLSTPATQGQLSGLPNVMHTIAVGAGKGGVGKSTVSTNLAVGLARKGYSVGLMDGDIYGPSMPTLLGLHAMETNVLDGRLQPFLVHGVKAMTIGKLVDADKPLIWRGPMAHGAFKQLVEGTDWGHLDYLIIDLPPGTGDVPLTLAQLLKLTGAVVVCTPQKVAQDDAVRAARMFQQLQIEVLGVVENMSYFIGDDGKEYDIFGRGGAEHMAQRLGVPFLGSIPLTMALRENSDKGDPSANFKKGTPLAGSLEALVQNLENQVALASMRQGKTRPKLTIS